MPVMDEFKEEREALKHGTPKQKLQYFLDYYKWPTLAAAAGLIALISFVTQIATSKDVCFYAAVINGTELEAAEQYNQGFAEYAGLDMGKNEMVFDSTMHITPGSPDQVTVASSQRLMVYIASKEIDVMATDPDVMENYALAELFYDLRKFLSKEQLEKYSPYFFYIDQEVVDAQNDDPNYVYNGEPQDHRDPDTMTNPVPVGIYLDDAAVFKECYHFSSDDVVLGITVNTTRPETASQYLDYLFQK